MGIDGAYFSNFKNNFNLKSLSNESPAVGMVVGQKQKQKNEKGSFLKGKNSTTQDCLQYENKGSYSRKHE